jgi:hypothetical protein
MSESRPSAQSESMSIGYTGTVFALMFALPVASILVECGGRWESTAVWGAMLRWFVFWAIGLRLFSAGVRQVLQPSFTAREIFRLESADANVIVRELGFANVCLGLTGLVAGFCPSWRFPAAFVGGLYFGLAGVMHAWKRPSSPNEWIALVSDLGVFTVVSVCFIHGLTSA